MLLSALLEGFDVEWLVPGEAEITSVAIDPKEAKPGALFVARQGWYFDTHEQLDAILAAGVAAIVVSRTDAPGDWAGGGIPVAHVEEEDPFLGLVSARFFDHPTRRLRVFGVTGTNGKTSVTYLLEHMLLAIGERPAIMGTIEYRLGGRRWPAPNTTPDGVVIQRFADEVRARGATALVMEVSSHALEIGRAAGVAFDSVGFTNLSPDHLDFHGDMESYFQSKRRLFSEHLEASIELGKRPVATACVDGEYGHRMLEATPDGVVKFAIGCAREAEVSSPEIHVRRASLVSAMSATGMEIEIADATEQARGRVSLLGLHNLENIAVALTMIEGVYSERRAELLAALADFKGVPGRFEQPYEPREGEALVFVDHAHSADSIGRILPMLSQISEGPTTIVVGCGGDRDASKRRPMARAALRGASRVFFTSDNPRSESASEILDEMMREVTEEEQEKVTRVEARTAAIEAAIEAGGAILVAGRGHEVEQKIGGRHFHHNDREEIRRIVASRSNGLPSSADAPLLWGWSPGRVAATLSSYWLSRGPTRPLGRLRMPGDEDTRGDDVWLLPASGRRVDAATLSAARPSLVLASVPRYRRLKVEGMNVLGVTDVEMAMLTLSLALVAEARNREGSLLLIQGAGAGLEALSRALGGRRDVLLARTPWEIIEGLAPCHRLLLFENGALLRDGDMKLVATPAAAAERWMLALWRGAQGVYTRWGDGEGPCARQLGALMMG